MQLDMADKITYHSAVTGKFVTKEYAEKNPDTTVEVSNCNLRQELMIEKIDEIEKLLNVPNVDIDSKTSINNMKILNILVELRSELK